MNLEEEFLKKKENDGSFPTGKNYNAIFTILKERFENSIHKEVKTKMLEIEKEGYYNDHGAEHIQMVIDRITKIIQNFQQNEPSFQLSDYETFILLVATHLHDAGHLISNRKGHAHAAKELLSRFDKSPNNLLDANERRIIGDIAKSHGGKDDPIGKLQSEDHLSGIKIRPRLLASILRLADELAEDKTRASRFLLHLQDEKNIVNEPMNEYSEIYHRFSESIDSIFLEGNVVNLSFCINSLQLSKLFKKKNGDIITDHYLLDEIYARCKKTFLETLYSNRFFPPQNRFTKITVKIFLLDELEDYLIKPISFVLEESGYPFLYDEDIFNMCKKDLIDSKGEYINGEYIANLIREKNNVDQESI